MADIADIPATQIPHKDGFEKIRFASGAMLCEVDGVEMSSYRFMEDMANNPDKYSATWKQALTVAGVGGVGATVGLPALIIASGPLAPLTLLASMIAAPFFGGNRACTILIANELNGNLTKSEVYMDCGVQTGRPVLSETDPETGVVQSSKPDVVPGLNWDIPELPMGGLGMYRFEKDLSLGIGFYGTGGAISFTSDDPKAKQKFAVSWLVPETGLPGFGVTADLSKYQSLQAFYEQTAETRTTNANYDYAARKPGIIGSICPRRYPDENTLNDLVLTAYIGHF